MANTPFFCFIHIEKSGGITLHNLFYNLFPYYISPSPKPRFGEFLERDHLQTIVKRIPFKIQGIGGHKTGPFLDYETLIKEDIFYFTFMRNPVSRYLSHLNWQKNVMKIPWTIEEFLEDDRFNNYQCYRISGVRDYDAAIKQIEEKQIFIGLLESYNESLLMLAKYLNMPPQKMLYERSNVKTYENQYRFGDQPKEIQEKIIANNIMDIKLYEKVKKEYYPNLLEKHGTTILQKELEKFNFNNQNFKFPLTSIFKRKIFNLLLRTVIQTKPDQ